LDFAECGISSTRIFAECFTSIVPQITHFKIQHSAECCYQNHICCTQYRPAHNSAVSGYCQDYTYPLSAWSWIYTGLAAEVRVSIS